MVKFSLKFSLKELELIVYGPRIPYFLLGMLFLNKFCLKNVSVDVFVAHMGMTF
jgi:hypothetical protein